MSTFEGRKVVAIFDYNGFEIQKNLLSFQKGDILEILESNETNWWKAKDSTGRIALIPANYIKEYSNELNDSLEKIETIETTSLNNENINTSSDLNKPIKKIIKLSPRMKRDVTQPTDQHPIPKPKKSPPKPPKSSMEQQMELNNSGNLNSSGNLNNTLNGSNNNLTPIKKIGDSNNNLLKNIPEPISNNGIENNPSPPLKNPMKNPMKMNPKNRSWGTLDSPLKNNPFKNSPNLVVKSTMDINSISPHTLPPPPPPPNKNPAKIPIKNNNNLEDNGNNNIANIPPPTKTPPPIPLKNIPSPITSDKNNNNIENNNNNNTQSPIKKPPSPITTNNNNTENNNNNNLRNSNNNLQKNIPSPLTNNNNNPPLKIIPNNNNNNNNSNQMKLSNSQTLDNSSNSEINHSEAEETISENSISDQDKIDSSIDLELSESEKKAIKMKKQLDSILSEVVQSERAFCKDVEILIQMYKTPLESELKIISSKDITSIFANINQIHGINITLLEELEKEKSVNNVYTAFKKMAEYLKVYSVYCGNQDLCLSTVETLENKNKEFKSFMLENESKFLSRGLPLKAFLIKPVQRICKYPLLLREVIRSLDESDPAKKQIGEVAETIETVVKHINDKRRMQEGLKGVIDVSEKIVGYKNIVKKSRLFIFGGNNEPFTEIQRVKKEDGEGGFKKEARLKEGRQIFLFNDMVLLCKPEKKKGKLEVMEKIKIADLRVEDFVKYDPLEFKVRNIASEKDVYRWTFVCKDAFNKMNWLEKFESVGAKKKLRDLDKLEEINAEMEFENLKIKIQKIDQTFNDIEKATLAIQKRIEKSEQIEATSEKAAKSSVEKFRALKAPTSSFQFQAREIRNDMIEAQKLLEVIQKKISEKKSTEEIPLVDVQNLTHKSNDNIVPKVKKVSKEEPVAVKKVPPGIGKLNPTFKNSTGNVNKPVPPNGRKVGPNNSPNVDKKISNKVLGRVSERPRSGTGSGDVLMVNKSPETELSVCVENLKNLDVKSLNFVEQMSKYKKNVRVKIVILEKLAKQLANM